jgi:hypothetical protein
VFCAVYAVYLLLDARTVCSHFSPADLLCVPRRPGASNLGPPVLQWYSDGTELLHCRPRPFRVLGGLAVRHSLHLLMLAQLLLALWYLLMVAGWIAVAALLGHTAALPIVSVAGMGRRTMIAGYQTTCLI